MTKEQESLLNEIEELNKLILHKRALGLNCSEDRKQLTKLILMLDGSGKDEEFST